MSDKKLKLKWNPKVGRLMGKILLMVLITALVCGIVGCIIFPEFFNVDKLYRTIKYWNRGAGNEDGTFSFDTHNSNCYGSLDGGLAVASVGGLNTYAQNGQSVFVAQGQLSLPQMQTNETMAMVYDVGGSTLIAVHEDQGEVLRISAEKPILDADLSENGSICYTSSAPGYKSVLAVYNKKQELIYRWLSSSTYMPVCAISQNGKTMAVVGLNQTSGVFESTLNYFRVDAEEIQQTVSLGNQLIYELSYVNENTLCAIGEAAVYFLDLQGAELGDFVYDGSYLKDYDLGGDGFLVLVTNMYRAGNRFSLVTLDETGNTMASVFVGREILDLSACGKYVAILTPDGLTVYNKNLQVYAQTETVGNATNILMRDDGTVLLLGAGEGRLYIP